MIMSTLNPWKSLRELAFFDPSSGFFLDLSRSGADNAVLSDAFMQKAFEAMDSLEEGAISNPDEKRMVGHYWLRNFRKAPTEELRSAISGTLDRIKEFSSAVHSGAISAPGNGSFRHLLVIGIGGSALGPQFVSQALRSVDDPLDLFFFDNTDPDGMRRTLAAIPQLSRTLVVVISKSGGTKETRNGQLVAKEAFRSAKLDFAKHFVAVTGEGSELDKTASAEGWLARFPMWDWVGGRTSETSAVGLLPAALQGFDIDEFLQGAREMDDLTRRHSVRENPAAMLAAAWYHLCGGRGERAMVMLPYSDRLEMFSRYLQQLLMESLGKEFDLDGKKVDQGIVVYGNKGSTDQHAYVQQLRDGLNNFFVVFIEVLKDSRDTNKDSFDPARLMVEDGVTSGDYLGAFLQGTRLALAEKGRPSITISIDTVNAHSVGMLIALFERAVGFYATLININAYHQPGVEAGKKAAGKVLEVQKDILNLLSRESKAMTAEEISEAIHGDPAVTFGVLRRLAANGRISSTDAASFFDRGYSRR